MINLDTFWGFEDVLPLYEVTELWHFYIVHFGIVVPITVANIIFIGPLLRLIDKRLNIFSTWLTNTVFGFSIIWGLIHGALILILGDQLPIARYLYVYFGVLVIAVISQTHIRIAVPDYDKGEDDTPRGKIKLPRF